MEDRISIEEYAQRIGLSVPTIKNSRYWGHSLARNVYWYYLRRFDTLADIGRMFNNRRHTTIISGIRTASNLIESGDQQAIFYMQALNLLNQQ